MFDGRIHLTSFVFRFAARQGIYGSDMRALILLPERGKNELEKVTEQIQRMDLEQPEAVIADTGAATFTWPSRATLTVTDINYRSVEDWKYCAWSVSDFLLHEDLAANPELMAYATGIVRVPRSKVRPFWNLTHDDLISPDRFFATQVNGPVGELILGRW